MPGSHNIYGDGSCSIVSIQSIGLTQSNNSGYNTYQILPWGPGNGIDYTPKNYSTCVYIGKGSSVGDSTSTVIGLTETVILPSEYYTKIQNPHDLDTYYYGIDSYYYHGPSPYLTDESRNPSYYQTSNPSSTSNAFSDFDGKGNTTKIVKERNNPFYAAECCNAYYTEGTKKTQWYLPSIGELGYLMVKLRTINGSITKINNIYNYGLILKNNSAGYWSSTEYDGENAFYIHTTNNNVYYPSKTDEYNVRAFLRVK